MSAVPSRDGWSAIFFATSPVRAQISTSCAKPFIGTVCENGFLIFVTSRYWPPGAGVTLAKIAGLPIAVLAPVGRLIAVSWLVK